MRFDELTFEEKRKFRYELQDYMLDFYKYRDFAGKRVLEIGCGAGIDSNEFASNGAIMTSVDFTEIAVKLTRDLIRKYSGQTARCSATILPFKNSAFDLVYSYGVVHHIPRIDSVLSEISRVLKSEGTFMGMVYNKDSLLYAYLMYHYGIKEGLIKKMSEEHLISHFSERREGCPHTKAYTIDEFSSLLTQYGFVDLDVRIFYNAFDLPGYKRKVKFQFDDKELNMGWHIAFRAEKT
jgi:ubiquinone/menaquinone biosynthesis C-methylase UbiE